MIWVRANEIVELVTCHTVKLFNWSEKKFGQEGEREEVLPTPPLNMPRFVFIY